MNYRQLLKKMENLAIKNEKEDTAIKILLLYASNKASYQLLNELETEVPTNIEKRFIALAKKYIFANIPIQYLTNTECFYGYDFYVDNNVLIPRRETEELVSNVLSNYDEYFSKQVVKVCDIGTGSGAIAITLALEEANMRVSASDISQAALKVAKQNATMLKAQVDFKIGDMLEPFYGETFDILVSNPPYIPNKEFVDSLVLKNEPHVALFGGEDGLKFYEIILKNAHKILNKKNIIAFEHGYDKKAELFSLAKKYFPNSIVKQYKDLQGKDRMTIIVNE